MMNDPNQNQRTARSRQRIQSTISEHQLPGSVVLVTGAGGFIGSHLVERLAGEGKHVRAFLHYNSRGDTGLLKLLPRSTLKDVEICWGDIRDANTVRKAVQGVEGVFHLAALVGIPYSYYAPDAYVATNVVGTLNLLQACLDQSIRFFVHTSTSEVYGTAKKVPMDEAHILHAQSPYAATKTAADQLALSFHMAYDLPVATIRPFNAFGPRQSPRAIIPTIVSQVLKGGNVRLGSIGTVRDFTFVQDTVNAFVLMASTKEAIGRVINVGSGEGTEIRELVDKITHLTGKTAKVTLDEDRVRPENSEVLRLICDNTNARTVLGWVPTYTLGEGLTQVIEFVNTHGELYQEDVYAI